MLGFGAATEPRHGDRARPTGAPELGAGYQRGDDLGARSPGRSPQPGRPPALAAKAVPELRAFAPARLGCPGAPSSQPSVGEPRLAERRPFHPVPDAQSRGNKEAKKDAEKRTLPGWSSRLPETLPKPGPAAAAAAQPAGGTARCRGAAEGLGDGLGSTTEPGSCSYQEESREHQASNSVSSQPVLPAPRLPCSSQPLGPGCPRSVPRPPRPQPRPLKLRPHPPGGDEGGGASARAPRGARGCTWSPCQPRPGHNQASRGGVPRVGIGKKRRVPCLRDAAEEDGPQMDAVCGLPQSRPFLAQRSRRREGTLPVPPASGRMASPKRGPRSPGTLPAGFSRAGRGRLFGLSNVLLIRND